ncbi:MAG: ImmA/IrrE family metallo-endopeptidase [Pirellulales bacterium]
MEAEGLDRFVGRLLVRLQIEGPAVDAVAVAKRLGIVVATDRGMTGRARRCLLSVGAGRSQAAIYVCPEERPERRQWSIAHELGEHLAAEIFAESGLGKQDATSERREQSANDFASALLLPRSRFVRQGETDDWDLPTLKQVFWSASHALIARRIAAVLPGSQVTIVDDGRVTTRLSNANCRSPLQPGECAMLKRCAKSGAVQERRFANVRLRCWPIHEAARRREILLTQATGSEF